MRRVVVTGLGLVTPLGGDVETTWKNILASKSGAGPITHFDASDQKCRIACEVKPADHEYGFDPNKRVDHKVQRQVDPFIIYGIDAAGQAIEDAGLTDMDEATRLRAGVSIGSGIGGLPGIESESLVLARERARPGQPALRPRPPDQPHLRPGLDQIRPDGPEPRGRHRLLDRRPFDRRRGADDQATDDADIMLAGGAEATICPIGIAGFAQARALSTNFNDQPEKASRPYDKDRDGFVMGEGAGVVVLEEYEHAKARGAKIYAEVVGYGLSGDAYHVTAPHPEGSGAYPLDGNGAARSRACSRRDIDYINAHGTSTPLGDELELGAVRAPVRQRDRQRVDELDQVGDRPPARRRRRGREHLLHPRDARPDRPADAQPRQSERGHARASTSFRTRRRSGRSAPCSTTASASAAPTPV